MHLSNFLYLFKNMNEMKIEFQCLQETVEFRHSNAHLFSIADDLEAILVEIIELMLVSLSVEGMRGKSK